MSAAETAKEIVSKVIALHKPERRYQLKGCEDEGSWDTPERVLEAYDDGVNEAREVTYFEICKECGRIEMNQVNLMELYGDEWGYETAIWPCLTAKAMGVEA